MDRLLQTIVSIASLAVTTLVASPFIASAELPVLTRALGSWDTRLAGSGIENDPYSIAVTADTIYISGNLTVAGGAAIDGIAAFDRQTNTWSAVPNPDHASVDRIEVFQNKLYIVVWVRDGEYTGHLELRRWNGTELETLVVAPWHAYVSLMLRATEDSLYVMGDFSVGDLHFDDIGRFDGESWHTVPFDEDGAIDVTFDGDEVYVTRYRYPDIDGVTLFYEGIETTLDYFPNDYFGRIVFFHGELYIVGEFRYLGPDSAEGVARWEDNQWREVGGGVGDEASNPVVIGDALYVVVGDSFQSQKVMRWDGEVWTTIGVFGEGSFGPAIRQMVGEGGKLFVAGYVTSVDGMPIPKVAWFDPEDSAWHGALEAGSLGLNLPSTSVAAGPSGLFIAGGFTRAGATEARHLARWNGNGWDAVGELDDDGIYILEDSPEGLFAEALFSNDVEAPVKVMRWDGDQWSGTPTPGNAGLLAMRYAAGKLYVLTAFSSEDAHADRIFVLEDGHWTPIPSEISGEANALAVTESGEIFVGGYLNKIEDVPVGRIARWDGEHWSSMGLVNGWIVTLAVSDDAVFVGGYFDKVDDVTYGGLARWENGQWSAVGALPLPGTTFRLDVDGNSLYALRGFYGEDTLNHTVYVLRWDGREWKEVSSGRLPYYFGDIAVRDGQLLASTDLVIVEGVPSNYVGHWSACDITAQSCFALYDGPCGDADDDDDIDTTDAMITLGTAVGRDDCDALFCDVNGSGAVTALDALAVLKTAVRLPVALACENPL
ncbi:MAG TPA: hypothetical protein VN634_06595 [Candidatus Limnocylindrales bacterium]|nr:hypothetical protein [Candidatus Limnocylindrales bacterium]